MTDERPIDANGWLWMRLMSAIEVMEVMEAMEAMAGNGRQWKASDACI